MARRRSVTTYCSVDGGRHAKGNGAAPLHLHAPSHRWRWCEDRRGRGSGRPSGVATPRTAEAVVSALGSDAARGLSQRRGATAPATTYGPNQLKSAPETPWWRRLLEQFQNFLVIILLVATVISMVEWLLQDPRESALPYEAIVILAIVVLNALLGYLPGGAGREVGARADGPCRPGIRR